MDLVTASWCAIGLLTLGTVLGVVCDYLRGDL